MIEKKEDIIWHLNSVSRKERESIKNQKGVCLWFTGLSGSGKSTLANAVEENLFQKGFHTYLLDGDNIRHGLNVDLGFSENDRKENIRRIGEVAKLFVDAGIIVITAFISPFKSERNKIRKLMNPEDFVEIFVDCPLDECIKRDPKGLYKKALANELAEFTGISSPYEPPENAELKINNTNDVSVQINTDIILNYLAAKTYIL